MWILENVNENLVFYLPCDDVLKVGRAKENYITLLNDKSISRIHASISVTHDFKNLGNEDKIPEIMLQDLSSTYGTYTNKGIFSDIKITQEPQVLKEKDVIRFGKMNNIFTLIYKPLVVTSSQILSKENLRKNILYLGGHLVKEWTLKCTLLVMNELKLTVKTVSALSSASQIVTPAYFEDMVNAVKSGIQLPEATSYLPVLKEPSINGSLVSFAPDPIRRTLFKGKIFIFHKKTSLKRMKAVIFLSGGQSIELLESNFSKVVEDNHIFIKSPDKEQDLLPSFVTQAFSLLSNNGLAAIPESDIGLAILYKDIEKFCNPRFHVNAILKPQTSSQSQKLAAMRIYATETQDDSELLLYHPISRTTIVETGESSKKGQLTAQLKRDVTGSIAKSGLTNGNYSSDTTIFNDSEMERENTAKRKRERSPSLENKSNVNKNHSSALHKKHICKETPSLLDDTEPIAIDEIGTVVFEPLHFSTERSDQSSEVVDKGVLRTISNEKDFTRKCNIRVTPTKLNHSKDSQDHNTQDEARVAKSIPFVPYTLPSLRLDDHPDQLDTVEDSVVVKGEPMSQNQLDSNVNSTDKRNWIGKRELDDDAIPQEYKRRRCVSPTFEKPFVEPQLNPTNLFALPFSSNRRRRKKESPVDIPATVNPKEQTGLSNNVVVPPETNQSSSDVNTKNSEGRNSVNTSDNNMPFISKIEPTSKSIKTECEATDDVSKLGEHLEKSLVVVQVVCLLKKPSVPSNPTSNSSSFGITNFKKFKKASLLNASSHSPSERSILPRIIGGKDLVAHFEISSRKEDFFASQPSASQSNDETPDEPSMDAAFMLPFPGVPRRRKL